MRTTARRLQALELQRNPPPPPAVFVCFCGTRRSDGAHDADCPALLAGDGDHVIKIVFGDVPEPSDGDHAT